MRETVVAECDLCGDTILKGEDYYAINGEVICTECIGEYAVALLTPFRMKGGEA